MRSKQKIIVVLGLSLIGMFVATATLAPGVYADEVNIQGNKGASQTCGGVNTSIINCSEDDGKNGVENSGVWAILNMVIQIMSAGVGVLALAGVVYGAVLYTSAGGNPEQVKKAKTMFTNVAIGVIAFAGMYTLLNFIIPGGVF